MFRHKNSSLFQIADKIALRKKNDAWLSYQKEILSGTAVEDIFWTIVWQIKTLMIIKKGGGLKLHSFVRQKTKGASALFSEKELRERSFELINLYHKSRLGKGDLSIGLEKFILKI